MQTSALSVVLRRVMLAAMAASASSTLVGCSASVEPRDGGGNDVVQPVDTYVPDSPPPQDVHLPPDVATDAGDCTPIVNNQTCTATVTYPCNPPPELRVGQPLDQMLCMTLCPVGGIGGDRAFNCNVSEGPNGPGSATLYCTYCAVGRRTSGLEEPSLCDENNPVGVFLANAATLEAASVTAFERLRMELELHGAPEMLLLAMERAANEERDHTDRVSRAARLRGVEPQAPGIDPIAPRSLFEIALENAREGCVRETFGALLAHWQAQHAADADLREMFEHIAVDETSHAALSWTLDAWITPRLSRAEQTALAQVRRETLQGLLRSVEDSVNPALIAQAGFPDTVALRSMLHGLDQELHLTAA